MTFYTADTIAELADAYETWRPRQGDLMTKFMVRTYRTEEASEYARHGLSRRLQGLLHGIDRTFEMVPPEADDPPNRDQLMDATAFIHSFIISVYGAIDNLARIWCLEAKVKQANGTAVPDGHIGLAPKNTTVRKSFSQPFQEYLKTSDPWFEYLENYRHALAHRIPLYIPPKTLGDGDGSEWKRLEAEMAKAVQEHDFQRYDNLFAEQKALGTFQPVMTHSFGEKAKPVLFHGQLLCDFATVVEIGENLFKELDGLEAITSAVSLPPHPEC